MRAAHRSRNRSLRSRHTTTTLRTNSSVQAAFCDLEFIHTGVSACSARIRARALQRVLCPPFFQSRRWQSLLQYWTEEQRLHLESLDAG